MPVNDADANIKVVLYPEKDGKPDMANAFGSQTYNIRELFGDYGYYKPERRSIKFDEPIKVKGTFYVAFEFDQIHLEAGSSWQRSYIGADTRRHANLQTTLYVLPEMLSKERISRLTVHIAVPMNSVRLLRDIASL